MWYFSFKASILFLLWWSSVHSLPISSTTSFYFIVCWIHRSPAIRTPLSHLSTLINMPVTTNQLILIQGFSFYLYKLTFGYGTHLSLLYLEAVFCLSGTNNPYSSCFVLIFPSPLSFFSCLCLLVPVLSPSGANQPTVCWKLLIALPWADTSPFNCYRLLCELLRETDYFFPSSNIQSTFKHQNNSRK